MKNSTFKFAALLIVILFLNSCIASTVTLKDKPLFQNDLEFKDDKPVLCINSGGHTSTILDVIFTKDGKHLISVSEDKSLKIWSTDNGDLVETIRFQIGPKYEGAIFAAALSPDNTILAVAGNIGKYSSKILLLDFASRKVIASLQGHTNTINDLSFSKNGKFLVSASHDNTVRVWDVENKSVRHVLIGHTQPIYHVAISPDLSRIVSASWDHTLILWDFEIGKKVSVLKGHKGRVHTVGFTPNSKLVVSGSFDGTVRLWDGKTGRFKRVLSNQKSGVVGLSISPDGNYVVTGCGNGQNKINHVISLSTGGEIASFDLHDNNVLAVAVSPDGKIVATGGGSGMEIYLWNILSGEKIKKMSGGGGIIWDVAFGKNGKSIAFGGKDVSATYSMFRRGGLEHVFDFTDGLFFKERIMQHDQYLQAIGQVDDITIKDEKPKPILTIFKGIKEFLKITRDMSTGFTHRSASLTPDGKILISGGQNGRLAAYNMQEKSFMHEFVGHKQDVVSLAVSNDGKLLISGSADQTIKLWNIATGENILSIFHHNNNEWVAWTPEGFYSASTKGDKYIGWHVNKGENKKGDYYSARQFSRFLYRPDIIRDTLKFRSSKQALANATLLDFSVDTLIKRAPVDVKISSVEIGKNGMTTMDVYFGTNKTTSPERIAIFINGAQVLNINERKLENVLPGDTIQYPIYLDKTQSHIRVVVENEWAETSDEIYVSNSDMVKSNILSSTLYITAVGINKYPNLPPDQQLNSPTLDVEAIIKQFSALKGILYKDVKAAFLSGSSLKITTEMIVDLFSTQAKQAKKNDVSLFFLAGHGASDNLGNYHFVTSDTECFLNSRTNSHEFKNSFNWKNIHQFLDQTLGKRIVIVDSCQAGSVLSNLKVDINRLVKDVHDVNAIIYSGTSRQQSALEISKGGIFTQTMLDGINGEAKYEGDVLSILSLKEYVNSEVPKRSQAIINNRMRGLKITQKTVTDGINSVDSVQAPVSSIPIGMESFIVSKKKK